MENKIPSVHTLMKCAVHAHVHKEWNKIKTT